jgi:hypothetical protein
MVKISAILDHRDRFGALLTPFTSTAVDLEGDAADFNAVVFMVVNP